MEIREYAVDLVLVILLGISTVFLIFRFWQDLAIALAACIMKVRRLEKSVVVRERMVQKYDMTISHLDELVAELSKMWYPELILHI